MKKSLLEVLWRSPIFLANWIGNIAIKLPTLFAGFIMVIPLYFYRKRAFDEVPKIFLPWQNPEDWNDRIMGTENSIPQWWVNEMGTGFWSFYKYHAIRNPANGLRNYDFIDLDLKEGEIYYWTPTYYKHYAPWYVGKYNIKTCGYIAWQGWKAGVEIIHIWPELQRDIKFKFFNLAYLNWFIWPEVKGSPLIKEYTLLEASKRYFVFKFGWRVCPRDAVEGYSETSHRWQHGAGFASKFLPYRKW